MKTSPRKLSRSDYAIMAACAAMLGRSVWAQPAGPKVINAAQPKYGLRAGVDTPEGVIKDRATTPEALFDNNAHSRYVITGAPYTINIELPFRIAVEGISFAHSDYESEAAPKELEITLDDGQVLRQTLELKRPEKRRAVWQDVPINKEIKSLKVKVLSNYDGTVKWGGMADIAVWTAANLDDKFRVLGYDAAAPVFVHAPPVNNDLFLLGTKTPTKMPPVAAEGAHPRLLLTPPEVTEMRAELPTSERGKAALAALLGVADGVVNTPPNFPDPKGPPAQLKDRGDEVAQRHNRISKNAGALGVAYALTGDAKYARAAAAIVTGYAKIYADYAEHKGANANDTGKVMAQRLSEAMWLIPLIEAYDYIYDSGALSDADKTLVETQLLRPAISFIRRKDPAAEAAERDGRDKSWRTVMPTPKRGEVGNWLNFYNTATMMVGAVLNDRNMLDIATADFRNLMMQGIGSDGMWGEGAIGYQMFALGAMVPGFETAARQGIDLWSFDNNRFKQLFDSPLRYAYPDGTLPGINDSARGKFGDWSTMVYDYAYLRYGDERYKFLVNDSPRQLFPTDAVYSPTRIYEPLAAAPTVKGSSTLFENLGYAILRDDNTYALMDYGPHGGVHGHFDKLNLLLFGRGKTGAGDELGGEPKFHRYEDPLHAEWTRTTIAHNTMSVDEKSQLACEGKLLVFENTPGIKLMRAESAGCYAGAVLDRTVVVTPDAVIDLYRGRSPFERTWDRTLRFNGKLGTSMPADANPKPLGQSDGYQHFQVKKQQPATDLWRDVWVTPAGSFNTVLAGAPGQQLFLGTGPDQDDMALARQKGTQAAFAAIYGMDDWGNAVQSARWLTKGEAAENGVSVFEMTQKDGTMHRVWVAQNAGAWQAAGWNSDARVLYLRQKGQDTQVLVGGGSFAKSDTAEFRRPSSGNYLLQQRGKTLETVTEWVPSP